MTSLCGVGEIAENILHEHSGTGVSDFAAVEYRETLIGL